MTSQRYLSCLALLVASTAALSAPVVDLATFATDRREANTVTGFAGGAGERTLWNLDITSAGPCSNVSVVVSRQGNNPFSLNLDSSPIFTTCNFSRLSIAFPTAADMVGFAGQTLAWSYTVTDASGSVSGLFPLIAAPEAVPYVQNIAVSDASSTPTISWDLPDLTGFDIDRIRVRVIDAADGRQIYQANLAPTATSYQLPSDVLQQGMSYFYRVTVDDLEGGRLENRSNAFSDAAVQVPEPATLALFAVGLAALAGFGRRRPARVR